MRNPDDLGWLETLVWPGQPHRVQRLRAAADLVAQDPPHLVAGDLLETLPDLLAKAPSDVHVVVFHSAVLAYLPEAHRAAFVALMSAAHDVTWMSNEGPGVLPTVTEQVHEDVGGRMILARDGHAVALVGGHGQSYNAL